MGKSQSLLSLASLYNSGEIGTGSGIRRKTFYLVANLSSAHLQDIYSPFFEQSEAFNRCVDNDLANLKFKFAHASYQQESTSVEHIKHLSLYCFGFIFSILADKKDSLVEMMSVTKFLQSIKGLCLQQKPVFIADEYITSDIDNRNVFRTLDLVVIILAGTDSKACNLLESSNVSRGQNRIWSLLMIQMAKTDCGVII